MSGSARRNRRWCKSGVGVVDNGGTDGAQLKKRWNACFLPATIGEGDFHAPREDRRGDTCAKLQ